jgi:tetratricopeptide (TPR) repeat protein
MTRTRAIVLLFLIGLLFNPSVGRAQVNRRLALEYLYSGTDAMNAGNLDIALAHFERAIELDPQYGASYFSRGLVRKRLLDFDGAISDFTRSIKLKPIAEAYLNRGATLKDKGDPDGAIADYNKAIEMKPNYADAFYNLGIARDYKGDLDGAIRTVDAGNGQTVAFGLKPGATALPRLTYIMI